MINLRFLVQVQDLIVPVFRAVLARETGVDHKSIQGYTLGEHGDSQMAAWSNVSFGGKPLCELEKEDPDHFAHLDKQELLKKL